MIARAILVGLPAAAMLLGAAFQPEPQPGRPQPPERPRIPAPDRSGGPWNDRIILARSSDGLKWTESDKPLMTRASVPDIIRLSKALPDSKAGGADSGTICIYTVDFNRYDRPGSEGLSRLYSTDGGKTWSKPEPVKIADKPEEGAAVDPSIVQLEDGRLRLYFYLMAPPQGQPRPPRERDPLHPDPTPQIPPPEDPTINPPVRPRFPENPAPGHTDPEAPRVAVAQPQPLEPRQPRPQPQPDNTPHRFYSAISSDGLSFEVERGIRIEDEGITDPEVVFVPAPKDRKDIPAEWLMFISQGQTTLLARSEDGLKWTREESFSLEGGGVPGAMVLDDGKVRVFQCGRRGITSVKFDPAKGRTEREEGERIGHGAADPAVCPLSDGTYLMILKRRSEFDRPRDPADQPPTR